MTDGAKMAQIQDGVICARQQRRQLGADSVLLLLENYLGLLFRREEQTTFANLLQNAVNIRVRKSEAALAAADPALR